MFRAVASLALPPADAGCARPLPRVRFRSIAHALLAGSLALGACEDFTDLVGRSDSAVQPPASVQWNAVTDTVISRTRPFTPQASQRVFAYVSLAQYAAATSVAAQRTNANRPAQRAAVAAASATVLAALFPQQGAYLDSLLHAMARGAFGIGAEPGADFAAGEAIGRDVGARTVALAGSDHFNATWTGTVPVGPGYWFSTANPPAPPLLPLLGQMRPFALTSGSQFRPAPPLAFGSVAFETDLEEVRHIADTRTASQDSLARFWAMNTGAFPPGFWNSVMAGLILQRRMSERDAARALAVMNAAGMDALIASHEAKFTYWTIRPSQADPAIRLAIPLPNFPSYPSNHATLSSACATVIAALFPEQSDSVQRMARDAAISRIDAGIHYRFDANAGLELGRKVAEQALAADTAGRLLAPLR